MAEVSVRNVMYRIEDIRYAPTLNEDETPSGPGHTVIHCREYAVLKTTPKGAWINAGFGDRKFVLKDARKRFADTTVEGAMASFIARKSKYRSILESRLQAVDSLLHAAEQQRSSGIYKFPLQVTPISVDVLHLNERKP